MKKTIPFILVVMIVLLFTTFSFNAEIYTYIDKDGNTVISNTPVPEKYEKEAKKIEAYKQLSPEEKQRSQAEEEAVKAKQAAIQSRLEKEAIRKQNYLDNKNYREQKEAAAKENKERSERAEKRIKEVQKENNSRRFFNSKPGKYSIQD